MAPNVFVYTITDTPEPFGVWVAPITEKQKRFECVGHTCDQACRKVSKSDEHCTKESHVVNVTVINCRSWAHSCSHIMIHFALVLFLLRVIQLQFTRYNTMFKCHMRISRWLKRSGGSQPPCPHFTFSLKSQRDIRTTGNKTLKNFMPFYTEKVNSINRVTTEKVGSINIVTRERVSSINRITREKVSGVESLDLPWSA